MATTVITDRASEFWGIEANVEYVVIRSYFYNGEGWYSLRRPDGSIFEAPDVFFMNIK